MQEAARSRQGGSSFQCVIEGWACVWRTSLVHVQVCTTVLEWTISWVPPISWVPTALLERVLAAESGGLPPFQFSSLPHASFEYLPQTLSAPDLEMRTQPCTQTHKADGALRLDCFVFHACICFAPSGRIPIVACLFGVGLYLVLPIHEPQSSLHLFYGGAPTAATLQHARSTAE